MTSTSTTTSFPLHLPPTLRILTLNCWGLKFISTHRTARLTRIGHELAHLSPPPQIVCLQECWTQADYQSIRSQTAHILPYAKYYHSGIFGGGLAIFSAFPIESSSMYRYPLNGRPTAFFRGDWFVGKGVAQATLRVGPGEDDLLEVLSTHLHAPYEVEPHDTYICHRTAQAWEIAKLARECRDKGRPVLCCGDFNMVPASLAHEIVRVVGGVKDVWTEVWPDASVAAAKDEVEKARGRPAPSVAYNLKANGTTCDTRANTWRMGKALEKRAKKGEDIAVDWEGEDRRAKRLDYIFLSGSSTRSRDGSVTNWQVTEAKVGMLMRHPDLHCSLSDHFSVEAIIQAVPLANETHIYQPARHLPLETHDKILALVHKYFIRERRQRKFRLWHFGVSILVSVGCHVAVWWSPYHFVSFLLMLLSTLGLAAGVVDGMIGGLFVGSELRALKEFEWEVRNARATADMAAEKAGTNGHTVSGSTAALG